MSVAEMKAFVAKRVQHVEDPAKLEQLVHILEAEDSPAITAAEIWAEIKTKHDGLMKRLA